MQYICKVNFFQHFTFFNLGSIWKCWQALTARYWLWRKVCKVRKGKVFNWNGVCF